MKLIGLIFCAAAIILYAADFMLAMKYGSIGSEDYPDEWSNKKAEKIHVPLSLSMIASVLLSVIFSIIASLWRNNCRYII